MSFSSKKVLGLIPARSGSKSIPHKNMTLLDGIPLVQWVEIAARESETIDEILCSTDDLAVRELFKDTKTVVVNRPYFLSLDDTPILDVIKSIAEFKPDVWAIALLQPTSPFVAPDVIDACVNKLKNYDSLNSVQTITTFPHNFHAYNQRKVDGDGNISFVFKEERQCCYNKQTKPKHYVFGNLVVTKTSALKDGVFAEPSGYIPVDFYHAIDIDGPADLELANWYLDKGKVSKWT